MGAQKPEHTRQQMQMANTTTTMRNATAKNDSNPLLEAFASSVLTMRPTPSRPAPTHTHTYTHTTRARVLVRYRAIESSNR